MSEAKRAACRCSLDWVEGTVLFSFPVLCMRNSKGVVTACRTGLVDAGTGVESRVELAPPPSKGLVAIVLVANIAEKLCKFDVGENVQHRSSSLWMRPDVEAIAGMKAGHGKLVVDGFRIVKRDDAQGDAGPLQASRQGVHPRKGESVWCASSQRWIG